MTGETWAVERWTMNESAERAASRAPYPSAASRERGKRLGRRQELQKNSSAVFSVTLAELLLQPLFLGSAHDLDKHVEHNRAGQYQPGTEQKR